MFKIGLEDIKKKLEKYMGKNLIDYKIINNKKLK
jgi:hypothetical protein